MAPSASASGTEGSNSAAGTIAAERRVPACRLVEDIALFGHVTSFERAAAAHDLEYSFRFV